MAAAVDLLSLSKFKLHLLALISEARDLRDGDRRLTEELHLSMQRQKQSEAAYERRLRELQAELASRDEIQHKLEIKVRYLENDNCLLEKKEKELRETINGLLQSREAFVSHYEDSTYSLKCSIEMRDRKLAVLSEKIHEHLVLFDSIEKEAAAVKQLVGNIQHAMNEKEQVGKYLYELKGKIGKLSAFENDFIEKIRLLENKITAYNRELKRRDTTILELKEHLKAEKINSNSQLQIEEKALLIKEEAIQKLTSEKQELHFELHNLELTVEKIRDTVINMSAEDQKAMSSVFEGQEVCEMTTEEENKNSGNMIEATEVDSTKEGINSLHAAMPFHEEDMLGNGFSCKNYVVSSCLTQPCPPQSECSDPLSTTNVLHISTDDNMGDCTSLVPHVDSESSTMVQALEAAPP